MPQLDGLRALAVGGVAWSHWAGDLQFGIPFAGGVNLFFVLSGFLITGILLDARRENDAAPWFVIRNFYLRRVLRIFPLAYLTIALCTILGVGAMRETWQWHASYLTNFHFFFTQAWEPPLTHFWSLAVEEQFYLVWPFLMIFLPRTWILPVILGAIVSAPLFVLAIARIAPANWFAVILPFSCLDALGTGALLAFLRRRPWLNGRSADIVARFLFLGLPAYLTVVFLVRRGIGVPWGTGAFMATFQAMFFGWLVCRAATGFRGWGGAFLGSTVLVYLGRISYGLYVFHVLAGYWIETLIRTFHLPMAILQSVALRVPIAATMTILAASLSWYCFERPFNGLKRFVPYSSPEKDDRTWGIGSLSVESPQTPPTPHQ